MDKLEPVPPGDFYDILKIDGSYWLAGEGLGEIRGGEYTEVFPEGRFTALAVEPEGSTIWYARTEAIGYLNPHNGKSGEISTESDFVWAIGFFGGMLYYFDSLGYGIIDLETESLRRYVSHNWQPRPFVMELPEDGIYVGDEDGLWRIGENTPELVFSSGLLRDSVPSWMERDGDSILLGTALNLYRWSGNPSDPPVVVSSNYDEFFVRGINNSAGFAGKVAVTAFPQGVALVDRQSLRVTGYVGGNNQVDLGDIFKVRRAGREQLVILGVGGMGSVDMGSESRFFPVDTLMGQDELRLWQASEDGLVVLGSKNWVRLNEEGFERNTLPLTPDWVTMNNRHQLVYGTVYSYETLSGSTWQVRNLSEPIRGMFWGQRQVFAVGTDGVHLVGDDLGMELIYPDNQKLDLVGELGSELYLIRGDRELMRLAKGPGEWQASKVSIGTNSGIISHHAGDSGVWIATDQEVYQVSGDEFRAFPCADGWQARSISSSLGWTELLYYKPGSREMAIGMHDGINMLMLSVPYLERLGEPLGLVSNATHVGIVGSGGVGWYSRSELARVQSPEVEFDLLLENRRIEDRTIPSGMHFIDLQIGFSDPGIPCEVEYRINEQRWRSVNLSDPSLTFAGHGNFTVELRAIHPNGNVSEAKVVQFGIAPPWYFNPLYQGLMLLLALLVAWGLFYLRSAQLKKTNLWLQSEVKKQTRELEAATAARTNFLAGLSHDIRNPLNGVLMIAETLSRNPPKDGSDSRLRDLTEFGIIVDRMLGEILDFSAIDERNIPTSFIPVSLVDIIDTSIKQNQFGIQKELVNLVSVIDPKLRGVVIRTDRNWMIKILSNLIINALEYSESERIEVGTVCHRISATEVDLELYVADWGKGIDPSEREYVFERFYRGESGIESGKHGTGLGLSICQEIAHAMGAHLRLEGNDPTGCRFVLKGRFDRVESDRELDREAVLASLKGKRILVVDDLVYNRRSVVDFFQTLGCQCDECENGREALASLDANRYYLALLDWDLPGLTGPEIARRHRKAHPDDPVLIVSVTAYTDGEKKRESVEAGMNGYISKPLTASRLAHCLSNIQDWKPTREPSSDMVDSDEVMEEIYKHIEDCLFFGEQYEWESLRRCAHRLTTLALIKDNKPMQQACRDIQVAASEKNIEGAQASLLELQKWRKP